MDFTIYTLGDVESFRAALTAVSMLFNPSNTTGWVSNTSSLGLGYMAALALTIGLTIMLFQGIYTLKFELGQLIVGVIVYCIMFIPKFSVNIEDYYTGTIQRVDNVPLGIALPGSAISAMTREISTQFNTAFSTTSANYMGFTQSGFMTPLKILNQLRYGAGNLAQSDPNLARTIQAFIIDCTAGRPEFDENIIRSKPNPMKYLIDTASSAGINGLTVSYVSGNPLGVNTTCEGAGSIIESGLSSYYGTATIAASTANPTGLSKFAKMISTRVNSTSAQTAGGFSTVDYEDSFRALTQLSGEQAKAFAITSLTSNLITTSRYCANNSANEADLARCLPTIQAARQYEEDSAASGTLFQRTMLHSMSIMLFLFYCFAPIVALLVLALGQKGLKIMGGYIVFGIWSQSWLPVATIINYFIQQKVFSEFAKFGSDPSQILTIADAPALYEMLSTNIAVASDLMAATPILTLALLTGSFFALTGVATRVSGKDYYDEKANTSSLVTNGAVSANTSAFGGTMGLNSFGQGMSSGPGINRQATQTAMKSLQRGYELSYDKSVGQAETEAYSALFANEKTAADSYRVADSYGATKSESFKQAFQKQYKMDDQTYQKFETSQRKESAESKGFSENTVDESNISGALMLPGGGKGGKSPVAAGMGTSKAWVENQSKDSRESTAQGTSGTGGGGETVGGTVAYGGDTGSGAALDKKLSYDQVKSLNEGLSAKYGKQQMSTSTSALTRAEKYKEMATETDQAAKTVGTTGSFTGLELANMMTKNPDFTEAVRQEAQLANMSTVGGFEKDVDRTVASFKGTALGEMDKDTQRDLARFFTLEKTDQQAYARVASELFDDNTIASFKPVDDEVAQDMFIGKHHRDSVLDKTPVEGPKQGTGRNLAEDKVEGVPDALSAADRLKNAGAQQAGVDARYKADKAEVVTEGQTNANAFKNNLDDPSYADVRVQTDQTLAALEGKIPQLQYERLQEATEKMAAYTQDRATGDGLKVLGTYQDSQKLAELGREYRGALEGAAGAVDKNSDLTPEQLKVAKASINESMKASTELTTARTLTKRFNPVAENIIVGERGAGEVAAPPVRKPKE